MFLLLPFFLLLFLIPRRPRVSFETVRVGIEDGEPLITQDVLFKNPNFYEIQWKNTELEIAYSDEFLGTYYHAGTAVDEGTFKVAGLKSRTQTYDVDLVAGAAAEITAMCLQGKTIYLLWQGKTDARAIKTDFHGIDVGPWYVAATCT